MPYSDLTNDELEAAIIATTAALVERTLELVEQSGRLSTITAATPPDELTHVRSRLMDAVDSAQRAIAARLSSPSYQALVADAPAPFLASRAQPRVHRAACGASTPQR